MYPILLTIALAATPCSGPTCPCIPPPAVLVVPTCEPAAVEVETTYDGRRHRMRHVLRSIGRGVGHLRPFHRR